MQVKSIAECPKGGGGGGGGRSAILSTCIKLPFVIKITFYRERSDSVVECLTGDRRAADSSLTGITALCP